MKLTTSFNETKNLHLKSNILNFLKPENIFLLIQIKQIKKKVQKEKCNHIRHAVNSPCQRNLKFTKINPASNYMFNVNKKNNTRARCEMCSKLIIKTTEPRH